MHDAKYDATMSPQQIHCLQVDAEFCEKTAFSFARLAHEHKVYNEMSYIVFKYCR